MTFILIGSLVILLLISGTLFINFYPTFGGKPTDEQKLQFETTGHYRDGKFLNQIPTNMDLGFVKMVEVMRKFFKNDPDRQPAADLPLNKIDSLDIVNKTNGKARLTWFGHSAFLLEMDGKNILIDPMLGISPAPHPLLGTKRYSKELPIAIDELPHIDAIILSHDHYDHLDYQSIMQLHEKTDQFYVPLGVGSHFRAWGIPEAKIHELDWWESIDHDNIQLVCTPARHFSGRGLLDRSSTLWASWVIKGDSSNIYFSGDSGYGPHFKEIGERFGPFDLGMMECGQYNLDWHAIHMLPEETVQAGLDVQAKIIIPIHWGAFTLSLHSWTEPVERLTAEAAKRNLSVTTPIIGQSITPGNENMPADRWWESVILKTEN